MQLERSITSIIPPNISWFLSEQDWIARTGVGAPKSTGPRRLWRDNSLSYVGNWWLQDASVIAYNVVARTTDGQPKLVPFDSPQLLKMYSGSIYNTLQSIRFIYNEGLPYLEEITLPTSMVRECNFADVTTLISYPVVLPSDSVLLPHPRIGVEVVTITELLARTTPPPMSAETKVQTILRILDGPLSADDKLLAISKLFESPNVKGVRL